MHASDWDFMVHGIQPNRGMIAVVHTNIPELQRLSSHPLRMNEKDVVVVYLFKSAKKVHTNNACAS